jgi:hypothetical protein
MSNDRFKELVSFLAFDDTTLSGRLDQHAVLNQEVCENVLKQYDQVTKLEAAIRELDNALRIQVREAGRQEPKAPTEAAVTERVESDQDLKDLREELRKANLEHTKWSNLRYDFQAMSKNMENKTKLIVSGFIAF